MLLFNVHYHFNGCVTYIEHNNQISVIMFATQLNSCVLR